MEGWIVVFDRVDELADVNADAELFADFPRQSLTRRLARLDLPAGEPPASGKSPLATASYYQEAVNWAYGEGIINSSYSANAT